MSKRTRPIIEDSNPLGGFGADEQHLPLRAKGLDNVGVLRSGALGVQFHAADSTPKIKPTQGVIHGH